ncbi:MAG TPA: hypothetical protein VGV17_03105 [Bosea sp. (in: a-proteobacteria)]|jgi:hypothetical protein|uniref:hypothetical protein n=1 Tax=Bosea sp. (in: a-proteobacteria) TaxID=1871050 RepID=UPI002DDDB987|nr:hypothetical protein [Bosea sp. (in: a-proteobacteria)]HEV2552734.1 hypothetical protein [Bosea sp. (in: a-proteobacteria)]
MGEALMTAALDIPSAPRFAMPERAEATRLPGELLCADEWHEVAAHLDRVANSIPRRMHGRGRFSTALAAFVANEVRQSAAEIRANLALEERDACMRRGPRG